MGVTLTAVASLALALALEFSSARASNIEWIRTAKDTADRLSPQPPLAFGADFQSSVTISINRF